MSRKMTEVGLQFREKFGYTGKITKEAMGKELWNEWCKLYSKKRFASPEHKKELAKRKQKREAKRDAKRDAKREQKKQQRRLNGKQYYHYCKNIEQVENFFEAQKSNFNGWILHHKLEQMFTADELKTMNIYYNCKPAELMFIKASEHNNNFRLHYGCRIRNMSKNGRRKIKKNEKFSLKM